MHDCGHDCTSEFAERWVLWTFSGCEAPAGCQAVRTAGGRPAQQAMQRAHAAVMVLREGSGGLRRVRVTSRRLAVQGPYYTLLENTIHRHAECRQMPTKIHAANSMLGSAVLPT